MSFVVGQTVMVQVTRETSIPHLSEFVWLEAVIMKAEYSDSRENVYKVWTVDNQEAAIFETHMKPFFHTSPDHLPGVRCNNPNCHGKHSSAQNWC